MKVFEGIVVSISMINTAVVEVSRRTPHPLYKKLIKRSKKLKADTAGQAVVVGNTVKITETRPVSKGKYFKITHILGEKKLIKQKSPEPTEEIKSLVPEEKITAKPVRKMSSVKRSAAVKAKAGKKEAK